MKKLRLLRACDVPLDEMTPVPGGHHCHHCDKMVYDLRRATYEEARAIGRRSDATPCVRYLPDRDGFARFRPSALAVGAALIASTSLGCEDTRELIDQTIEHAAHRGEPHTPRHTEEYGLAGVAPPEFFEETPLPDEGELDEQDPPEADETSPEGETPPGGEAPAEGEAPAT